MVLGTDKGSQGHLTVEIQSRFTRGAVFVQFQLEQAALGVGDGTGIFKGVTGFQLGTADDTIAGDAGGAIQFCCVGIAHEDGLDGLGSVVQFQLVGVFQGLVQGVAAKIHRLNAGAQIVGDIGIFQQHWGFIGAADPDQMKHLEIGLGKLQFLSQSGICLFHRGRKNERGRDGSQLPNILCEVVEIVDGTLHLGAGHKGTPAFVTGDQAVSHQLIHGLAHRGTADSQERT